MPQAAHFLGRCGPLESAALLRLIAKTGKRKRAVLAEAIELYEAIQPSCRGKNPAAIFRGWQEKAVNERMRSEALQRLASRAIGQLAHGRLKEAGLDPADRAEFDKAFAEIRERLVALEFDGEAP